MLLLFAIALTILLSVKLNRKIKNFPAAKKMASLPIHYIYCFVLWAAIFSFVILISQFDPVEKLLLLSFFVLIAFMLVWFFYQKKFNAKNHIELQNRELITAI